MDNSIIATLGFVALFVLMALRVPIAVAMGGVGIVGFAAVSGFEPALGLLAMSPLRTATDQALAMIPMFVLMGAFASAGGISRELFKAAESWVGHQRGGLAVATIGTSGAFAAICGSSVAMAATMSKVALPEMRRFGYKDSFSAGVIAAGGTLGILIPPSIALAVYGILTEQDIGKLFVAGLIPGVVAILFQIGAVKYVAMRDPDGMPVGQRQALSARLASIQGLWAVMLLFVGVIGGMYAGLVTATEAAALGAVGAFLIGVIRKRLNLASIREAMIESLRISVSIMAVMIGALLFGYFLTITQVPQHIAEFLTGLPIGPYGVLMLILLLYLALGCALDSLAMMVLTVPILFPVVTQLGFDPIWFGVIVVVVIEIGLITPPVGMNVFVINSVVPDISLTSIFRGVVPFIVADVMRLAVLVAFPILVTWLPSLM
jgi:C4-dicarboxylate transporter, DctM subunit